MSNTYWSSNGKFQATADKLQALIPRSGSVENPRKNAALEKYRKAVNCYYDLYNNGLCNRSAEFRVVYDIPSSYYGSYGRGYGAQLYVMVEIKLDAIIAAAAEEQGIELTTQQELFA
jgi:hypothetical protein